MPSSSRTLMKTPRVVQISEKSGMEYKYFSTSDELRKCLNRYRSSEVEGITSITLALNVDGLQLFKSSANSLWPVLCSVVNLTPTNVFPLVITYGKSKPNNLDYLDELISDLAKILKDGFLYMGRMLAVTLKCVVCDAPARAYVKNIKLCTGYFGCDKCAQHGDYEGRVIFPEVDGIELRTDSSFRKQSNKDHHHGPSPFCNLDQIDMITQFPVDYMHQVCLGVTKKLLLLWVRGSRDVKMSAGQLEQISGRLVSFQKCVPRCFARMPRGLAEIDRWKATEFRQFLLYTGKIALHGILRNDLYQHFLVLNVAIAILVSPSLCKVHLNYAHELLKYFIRQGAILYGRKFLVYNVHSLLHLSDDVRVHGPLDAFSAFNFENYMQTLKRSVRSGHNPVSQMIKRLEETSEEPLPEKPKSQVGLKKPNNAYILNKSCYEVLEKLNQVDEDGNSMYMCRLFSSPNSLFVNPCDSGLIGTYTVCANNTSLKHVSSKNLEQKAMMIDLNPSKIIFMALQHQYE